MLCPNDQELAGYGAGQVGSIERFRLEEHVDACESCRVVVGALARQSVPRSNHMGEVGGHLGRYPLLRTLGKGAMGRVFASYDSALDRPVAIKILADQSSSRLQQEARTLAKLSHPNVVAIYEIGRAEGQDFVVMEYVEGLDLSEWLSVKERGFDSIMGRMLELCEGVHAVHEQGLVHRDIKMENILIGHDGRLRLSDFGLAALSPTKAAELAGTLLYMAPEQHRAESLTASADQYSLALVICEALWGVLPINLQDLQNVLAQKEAGLSLPISGGVSDTTRAVLTKALHPDPELRFDSTQEFGRALQATIAPTMVVRRHSVAFALGVAVTLASIVTYFLVASGSQAVVCQGADSAWGSAWDAEDEESLRSSFARLELPYGEQAMERLNKSVSDYATQWKAAHTQVCRSSLIDKTTSTEVMQARMYCLEEARGASEVTLELLARGKAGPLSRGLDIVDGLPKLRTCVLLDPSTLPVVDEAQRSQRADRQAVLARLNALIAASSYEEAEQLFLQTPHSSELALADLEAEVLLAGSRIAEVLQQATLSTERLRSALLVTERAGLVELRAQAGAAMLRQASDNAEDPKSAAILVPIVEALGASKQAGPKGRMDALRALGAYHSLQGDTATARRYYELAMAEAQSDLQRGNRHKDLCVAVSAAGDYAKAKEHCEMALATLQKVYGAQHPVVATVMANQGILLVRQGDTASAVALLGRAGGMFEATLGGNHTNTLKIRRNLGSVHFESGNYKEALAVFEELVPLFEETFGDRPGVAALLADLALTYKMLGRIDKSRDVLAKAIALLSESYPDGHPRLALALVTRSELEGLASDWSRACDTATEALLMLENKQGKEHPQVIHPLKQLATCREELGQKAAAQSARKRVSQLTSQ